MEEFETKAIISSPHPPYLWKRFVDDTFTIIKSSEKTKFLEHLNTIDSNIHFTSEECIKDGSMHFLDILITPKEGGSLSTTMYRKPTHTDLYLQWDSNHTVSSKYSVIGSSHHRTKNICSSQELLQQEEDHLKQALTRCKYPAWAINKVKIKTKATANKTSRGQKNSDNNIPKPHMVILYYKGISESLKNTCRKHGVQVYFKGGNTIKNLLMAPKDKDAIQKKVESFLDTSVTGWNVMRNTLENPQEHLERGSKNTSRHPPLYMTIWTPLVTMSPQKIST